jgi:hypothetical protein
MVGIWRKLHNEELRNFDPLPSQDGKMGRACTVDGGRRGIHIGFWWGNQKERDN